jgi:hypothetical protein
MTPRQYLIDLVPETGYLTALAVEVEHLDIKYWEWKSFI